MSRKPPVEPTTVTVDVKLDEIADMVADRIFARMGKFIGTLERLVRDNTRLQSRVESLEEMIADVADVARSHGVEIQIEQYKRGGRYEDGDEVGGEDDTGEIEVVQVRAVYDADSDPDERKPN